MTAEKRSIPDGPRFAVGKSVTAFDLGTQKSKVGTVAEIIESMAGDNVYRYRVRFADGGSEIFFGFELEVIEKM